MFQHGSSTRCFVPGDRAQGAADYSHFQKLVAGFDDLSSSLGFLIVLNES